MNDAIALIDWLVIAIYLILLVVFAMWLSRSQESRADYYVGGRKIGAWPVAISVMATQCSTNSILGAPAFVAFSLGGGLVWLQYELALPLAMIVLILWLMPVFRRLNLVSVYEFLEQRFDLKTRLVLSLLFQFVRAFASAVTVYSIAIVIDLITGVGFVTSVILLGVFTVVYDVIGGMRGVIYSDVIQMLILVVMLVVVLAMLAADSGGMLAMLDAMAPERRQALDFSGLGLSDGNSFGFWPMLVGGVFLYIAYYGCDQSQVQRLLSTPDIETTNKALFINGLLRFPLVLVYCLVGAGIAVYTSNHADFLNSLPHTNGSPEYNLAVPVYMVSALPPGVVGLALVALFAAAMSSLDSVLNSLSATTMEDFVLRFSLKRFSQSQELWLSRIATVFWGIVTLVLAFFVGDISPTVIETINKIGSLANGSILAVFIVGLTPLKSRGSWVIAGLMSGIAVNLFCWQYLAGVSWLWWNLFGFIITGAIALLGHMLHPRVKLVQTFSARMPPEQQRYWLKACAILLAFFVLMLMLLMVL